jgi:hypothetical protein
MQDMLTQLTKSLIWDKKKLWWRQNAIKVNVNVQCLNVLSTTIGRPRPYSHRDKFTQQFAILTSLFHV